MTGTGVNQLRDAVSMYIDLLDATANSNGPDANFQLTYTQFVHATQELLMDLGFTNVAEQLAGLTGQGK